MPLKILLSAYACEPGKGSEPGVGWEWAKGLSSRASLTVLTRSNNRNTIEKSISEFTHTTSTDHPNFLYYDLPRVFLWAKRRGFLPNFIYYLIWQFAVARKFRVQADNFDVVHHLTFCSILCPGFWRPTKAKTIIGPIGAPLVNDNYMHLFGVSAWSQKLRGLIIANFHLLPWVRSGLGSAATIIPANTETAALLKNRGFSATDVMLDTGMPELPPLVSAPDPSNNKLKFIHAGILDRRKAIELSLRALAGSTILPSWSFELFGDGPDRIRLEQLSRDLGIAAHVIFHGKVDRVRLLQEFRHSDIFLFTSIRDTSGSVNLEAMACGLPVICIAHQGVGDITDDTCAERISPGPIDSTIALLSASIEKLANNPERRKIMGKNAHERAIKQFSWELKFNRMVKYYKIATNNQSS